MLKYEILVLGELATNCYLVWDDKTMDGVVIDPADDGVGISEEVERLGVKLKMILATHGHFDHVMGGLDLKLIYKIPFGCSSKDQFLLQRQQETARYFLKREIEVPDFKKIDLDLDRISAISFGKGELEVIKTPGHTPGGVSFCGDKLLFTGDTLFASGTGRTDLSYSSKEDLQNSIRILNEYIRKGAIILPGHEEIQ